MRIRKVAVLAVAVSLTTILLGNSFAQNTNQNNNNKANLQKAQNTVNNISPAQPVRASSGPKASPVGQPVTSTSKTTGYKPAQKSPESKKIVVPSPGK
jgi:hypothetical protein